MIDIHFPFSFPKRFGLVHLLLPIHLYTFLAPETLSEPYLFATVVVTNPIQAP